jgi:hypothetical protein
MKSFIQKIRLSRFVVQGLIFMATFGCGNSGGGCNCYIPPDTSITLGDNQVALRFNQISFIGDFSAYASANQFILRASEDPANVTGAIDPEINFSPAMSIVNSIPVLNPLIPDSTLVLNSHQANPATDDFPLSVFAEFNDTVTSPVTPYLYLSTNYQLKPKTQNDISLTVDISATPVLNILVDTNYDNVVPDAYVYDVGCTVIHGNSNLANQSTKLNIAVMAEGYRADQINDFVAYANDAFSSAGSFQYVKSSVPTDYSTSPPTPGYHIHYSNDFYNSIWSNVNVVRYDTISPEAGVDLVTEVDNVKSILGYNQADRKADMNRVRAPMYESNYSGKCHLKPENVDVIIVFVNIPPVTSGNNGWGGAHSWVFNTNSLGNRNQEPVHYVVLAAPVGYVPTDANFHANVRSNSIGHELGHALASLQDEYETNNDLSLTCDIPNDSFERFRLNNAVSRRNITMYDDYGSLLSWNQFINDYGNAPNYPVNYFQGGHYCDHTYYRPTLTSTMRGINATLVNSSIQFGPLNTYYMYGTYRNRVSDFIVLFMHDYFTYYDEFKSDWPKLSF